MATVLLGAGDLGELLPQAPLNAAADPASQSASSSGLSGGAIAGAPRPKAHKLPPVSEASRVPARGMARCHIFDRPRIIHLACKAAAHCALHHQILLIDRTDCTKHAVLPVLKSQLCAAGIVIACIVGAAILAALATCFALRGRRRGPKGAPSGYVPPQPSDMSKQGASQANPFGKMQHGWTSDSDASSLQKGHQGATWGAPPLGPPREFLACQ